MMIAKTTLCALWTAIPLETILGELYRAAWESEWKEMRPEMGGGGFVVRDPEARLLVHCFAVASGTPFSDLDEWKRANPAPWRTRERIADDLASKDFGESEMRRLFGNEWTSARDRWIPSDTWEHASDASVEIPEGALGSGRRKGRPNAGPTGLRLKRAYGLPWQRGQSRRGAGIRAPRAHDREHDGAVAGRP